MDKVVRNAEYTKEYNRKLILRLLRNKPVSRAELARMTGLTRASASLIATELLEEGKIKELKPIGGQRGRMPTPLAICDDAGYAIGIYLNRDGCTAGIVDMADHILKQERIYLEEGTKEEQLEVIKKKIEQLLFDTKVDKKKIWGIGVSAPGPLDGESGEILNPPQFDFWHNMKIGPLLQNKTGFPVFLENNATCLARYYYDSKQSNDSKDFLLLLVDSGIGSGVISKGKVLKGAGYFTSEIGHISIDYQGPTCPCGNIGCLEVYAAIPNLLRGTKYSSWRQVIDDAETELNAREIIKKEVDYLSVGILNMIHIINIDSVILAGDLLYGADKIIPLIEEKTNARALRRDRQVIKIYPGLRTKGIGILSAANIVFGRGLMI